MPIGDTKWKDRLGKIEGRSRATIPVGDVKGESSGDAKAQPVCSSSGLSGFVRFQVGCTTDSPITSSNPWNTIESINVFNAQLQ